MTRKRAGWDWWSEIKLEVLREYVGAFTRAVRGRSTEALYLDLFAGSYQNDRRHGSGSFPGSASIALEAEPGFTRLALFELPEPAQTLRATIEVDRPADRRWRVFSGDCNATLPDALHWLDPVRWAPTFAFLDPRGLQVQWTTIEALAKWRADKKTKVEQWILLPEPALARVLGLRGVRGTRSAERLDLLFGSRDWAPIHQMRRADQLSPDEMRAEFVNLLRWRLERNLGYKTTHALQIVNSSGAPIYTLIFATDSTPGDRIMQHVYGSASTRTIPSSQARAQADRQRRREEEQGVLQLPGLDPQILAGSPMEYEHMSPWQPPEPIDDRLDLDGEVDSDPDEIDFSDPGETDHEDML